MSIALCKQGEPDSKRLIQLAKRHSFQLPPLLLRLFELRESNSTFRTCFDSTVSDLVEVYDTSDAADLNLISFWGVGNGDEYALYIYPPWCNAHLSP